MVQVETRRLAAIMFTDIVGFSHQMGADEARMLRLLDIHNQIIKQAVTGDVFGEGVNIASRLQTLAEPDAICISDMVYRDVAKRLDLGTVVSLGRPQLKGITERFLVYTLLPQRLEGFRQTLEVQRWKLKRQKRVWQVAVAGLAVGVISVSTLLIKSRYFPTPAPQPPQEVFPTGSQSLPLPDKPSIVVLPFDNMSGDSGQDYFSNGITEVLTSDLSRISSLFVIARNTAFTYKGKATNVQAIGKELGVRYVLEGSVQRAGEQVRIIAQLVDTTTDAHVWSERYDRPVKDIFALQDEIVQSIVTTLKLQLSVWEQEISVRKRTDNLEAYDYLLRGIESFWRFTKEANAQAQQMFEKALVLDPQYAEVYARLGFAYYLDWQFQWKSDPKNLEQAFALAQRAITLDDSLPVAHRVLGLLYLMRAQYEQAMTEAERIIALDPNSADGYVLLGDTLNFAGRSEEAVGVVEKALRLNPHAFPTYFNSLAAAYLLTDRYAEAIAALKQVLNRSPNFLWSHTNLAVCFIQQWAWQLSQEPHLLEQALAAAQRAAAISDSMSVVHSVFGFVYLWQKQYDQATSETEQAVALSPDDPGSYVMLANVLTHTGRPEEAITMIENA
ncbi:MAG: tetratricopeptide repeat protein, partial [Deltaproteobacteria bacterium]|nr:tetratricopeptide repeat protein [Deltaproteobacteria bacterium]